MSDAYAVNAYSQSKIAFTTNPLDLVIMLYNSAIDVLGKASISIKMKEIQIKIKYIDKAMAIIEELHNSLNLEAGGEVALNLQRLYLYMMRELVLANAKNDGNKISHIIDLLKELREAWVSISLHPSSK